MIMIGMIGMYMCTFYFEMTYSYVLVHKSNCAPPHLCTQIFIFRLSTVRVIKPYQNPVYKCTESRQGFILLLP